MMKYSILVAVLVAVSGCNLKNKNEKLSPALLMLEFSLNQRFTSPDQVADWLINDDPSLRLIDVRKKEAFENFSLPGSLNIPLDQMLLPEKRELLDCEKYFIVYYSNDDIVAEQAWFLGRQMGCDNSFILKGGLNAWTETILKPTYPGDQASTEELELYEFRKAASLYFIGANTAFEAEPYQPLGAHTAEKKKVMVQPKKKATAAEDEGC